MSIVTKIVRKAVQITATVIEKTKELMAKFLNSKAGHVTCGLIVKGSEKVVKLRNDPKTKDKWELVKFVLSTAAGLGGWSIGASACVLGISMIGKMNTLHKIAVAMASFGISNAVSDVASDGLEKLMDTLWSSFVHFAGEVQTGLEAA